MNNINATVQQQHKPKEKLSEALKSCNETLKELFSKKHSVRRCLFKFVFFMFNI